VQPPHGGTAQCAPKTQLVKHPATGCTDQNQGQAHLWCETVLEGTKARHGRMRIAAQVRQQYGGDKRQTADPPDNTEHVQTDRYGHDISCRSSLVGEWPHCASATDGL